MHSRGLRPRGVSAPELEVFRIKTVHNAKDKRDSAELQHNNYIGRYTRYSFSISTSK